MVDPVEIREALHEVVGVPLEDHLDALVVRLEHEGAGADHRIRMVEVLELVLRLAGQDRAEARAREVVEERGVRLLQRDPHGVAVHRVDRLHRLEALPEARLGHEALERVLHVLGGDLAPVHRGLVVEAHTFPEGERVDLAVLGHRPLLGQVGQDGEVGGRLLLRPVGEPDELAVGQAHVGMREEADREVRVQSGRLPLRDPDHPAALGRLGRRGVSGEDRENAATRIARRTERALRCAMGRFSSPLDEGQVR